LSDSLRDFYGDDGLRYSLMTMLSALLLSGGVLLLCGRAMPADLEE